VCERRAEVNRLDTGAHRTKIISRTGHRKARRRSRSAQELATCDIKNHESHAAKRRHHRGTANAPANPSHEGARSVSWQTPNGAIRQRTPQRRSDTAPAKRLRSMFSTEHPENRCHGNAKGERRRSPRGQKFISPPLGGPEATVATPPVMSRGASRPAARARLNIGAVGDSS